MSQTIYGGPLDNWHSRTISIRDGVVCVDEKAKIERVDVTIALSPPPPESPPEPPTPAQPEAPEPGRQSQRRGRSRRPG